MKRSIKGSLRDIYKPGARLLRGTDADIHAELGETRKSNSTIQEENIRDISNGFGSHAISTAERTPSTGIVCPLRVESDTGSHRLLGLVAQLACGINDNNEKEVATTTNQQQQAFHRSLL